ncbi:hypothetical protein NXY44_00035, partial [Phocaeicola vulgatus]|uniref:hypothetical protein n=1 Tax=Phocaeicola vulgatus TaxID=821 RepID=UPI002165376C
SHLKLIRNEQIKDNRQSYNFGRFGFLGKFSDSPISVNFRSHIRDLLKIWIWKGIRRMVYLYSHGELW